MAETNKSDKDIILTEISKVTTRLESQGYDMTGVFFGVNEKMRNKKDPKPLKKKIVLRIRKRLRMKILLYGVLKMIL